VVLGCLYSQRVREERSDMGAFELYQDSDAQFRFRILDDDGRLVAESVPHASKSDAVDAINTTRNCAASSLVKDRTAGGQVAR
jgi:uncharacterized protein YegP (UPF0339 family)